MSNTRFIANKKHLIRNTVKIRVVLFLIFLPKDTSRVAYLFLIFSQIPYSLFLKMKECSDSWEQHICLFYISEYQMVRMQSWRYEKYVFNGIQLFSVS